MLPNNASDPKQVQVVQAIYDVEEATAHALQMAELLDLGRGLRRRREVEDLGRGRRREAELLDPGGRGLEVEERGGIQIEGVTWSFSRFSPGRRISPATYISERWE